MTLMPAQVLEDFVPQMKKKGRLQEGSDADIVVFNPKTIAEKGTYEDPNHPAVGVQSLLVNGVAVVEDGQLVLSAAPGQPIRRAVQASKTRKSPSSPSQAPDKGRRRNR
jgi:N-acyl-D-glutamate deacylase